MARNLVEHARRHVIAYLALVCGLLSMGGAAYASFRIPNGSVGERQLKNHVIDPVKWDTAYVTGFVRRWATISPTGSILSTAPNGQSERLGPGQYVVTWGDAFGGWCAPLATVIGGSATRPTTGTTGQTGVGGIDRRDAGLRRGAPDSAQRPVDAASLCRPSATDGPPMSPYRSAVVCGPGAGSGQQVPTALP